MGAFTSEDTQMSTWSRFKRFHYFPVASVITNNKLDFVATKGFDQKIAAYDVKFSC